MRIARDSARLLIAGGWVLIGVGELVQSRQILSNVVPRTPWEIKVQFALVPLNALTVAIGWLVLVTVSVRTQREARRIALALAAFAITPLDLAIIAGLALYELQGAVGSQYWTYQVLLAAGGATATIGFVVAALRLRAAVLDLPGVVGDVVPDLAQQEPEGPAPVG